MNQSDQDYLSDNSTSVRGSEIHSEEDSVDIITTDCCTDDFDNERCGNTNVDKNKFSIANILGLGKREVACDNNQSLVNVESEKWTSDEDVQKVKCIKPTPISAAVRNTGLKIALILLFCCFNDIIVN